LISYSAPPTVIFFFTDPAPTQLYTLSLHDALPISPTMEANIRPIPLLGGLLCLAVSAAMAQDPVKVDPTHYKVEFENAQVRVLRDRKSTRLNSSHVSISYAVFCLKKKKTIQTKRTA